MKASITADRIEHENPGSKLRNDGAVGRTLSMVRIVSFVALVGASWLCSAAPLTLHIQNPDRYGAVGTTQTFSGTIGNDTGADILASDLFLNFSGFDFSVVSLNQLLGAPDFLIANSTTSALSPLFEFTLSNSAAVPTTYFTDVVLQDVNGHLSDVVTVSVSTVPEPSTWMLVVAALLVGSVVRVWPLARLSREAVAPGSIDAPGS